MNTSDQNKILIMGVTASGKATLGFELAKKLGGEIVSVDSMKVYRRLDIGTAKPSKSRQEEVGYHLIDVVEPSEEFSVGRYIELQQEAEREITSSGKDVIFVGGTALYIKAMLYGLFDGPGSDEKIRGDLKEQISRLGSEILHDRLKKIDPEAAGRIHSNDAKRIVRALEVYELTGKPISSFQRQFDSNPRSDLTIIGLRREKEIESSRINARVRKMVEMGLVEEVKSLLAEEKPLSKQAAQAIGYAEIIAHLDGRCDLDTAVENIKINTRRLAKHQRTWFRRFPNVHWIDIGEDQTVEDVLAEAEKLIAKG